MMSCRKEEEGSQFMRNDLCETLALLIETYRLTNLIRSTGGSLGGPMLPRMPHGWGFPSLFVQPPLHTGLLSGLSEDGLQEPCDAPLHSQDMKPPAGRPFSLRSIMTFFCPPRSSTIRYLMPGANFNSPGATTS